MEGIPLPDGNQPHKIKIQLKSKNKTLQTSLRTSKRDENPKKEESPKKRALLSDIFGSDDETDRKGKVEEEANVTAEDEPVDEMITEQAANDQVNFCAKIKYMFLGGGGIKKS